MKRALAERARGDSGTPSPTKKFARFGGRGAGAGGGERATSLSSWEGGAQRESGGGGVINEQQQRHAPPPQDRSRAPAPAHHDYNAVQQQQSAMGSIPVDHGVTAATVGVQGSTGSGLVKMTNHHHHHQHHTLGHDQGATTATNTVDSSVPFGDIAPPLSSPSAAAEVPSGSIPISIQQQQQVQQQQPTATTPSVVSNASSAVPPPPQSQSQAQTPPIRSPQPPPSYSSAVAAAAMTGFGLRRTSSKPSVIHSTPVSSSGGNNDRADASAAADDDDEYDEEEGTSPTRRYYLQFQNRALVTELHRLKHELSVLSDERTVRRAECTKARTAVEELHECWRGLEVELARAVGDSSASDATTRHAQAPPQSRPPGEEEEGVAGDEDGRTRRRQQQQITVPSSGEGTDVESSGMLLASLGRLAVANSSSLPPPAPPSASPPLFKEGEDPVAAAEAAAALDYAHLTTSLLDPLKARVEAIASLLLRLVREYHRIAADGGGAGVGGRGAGGKRGSPERIEAEAERTRASMQSRIDAQTVHIAELAAGRDAATKAERRLRRYLNRIAAGQSPEEVLRDVEGLHHHHHNALDEDEYSAASSAPLSHLTPLGKRSRRTITSVGSTSSTTAATPDGRRRRGCGGGGGDTGTPGADGEGSEEGDRTNDELARRYRAEVVELEGVAGARQERIEELMREREGLQRRVNKLLLPSSSSSEADGRGEGAGGGGDDPGGGESREAVSRHPLYQDLAAKLDLMSQQNELLKQDAEEWKAKLASKVGEIDALKKGMDDQRSKFEKRWKECVSEAKSVTGAADKEDNGNRNEGAVPDVPSSSGTTSSGTSQEDSASKILILEHKLEHALESARRIEVYRSALSEACAMVESLQRQGTDLREKYHNALSANRQSSSSSSSSHRSKEASDRRGSDSGPSSSSLSSEKLQRENKKFRKEILALQLSRDANKSKLERLQNDKDNLVKTNSRLVQQSSEKEEINAEALSTILHLKQQLELHSQEKEALEKKKKSVEQLALASRLAANAKERVTEEEKLVISEMEKGLDDAKRERVALLETIREKDSKVEQTKHQMVSLVRDLQITKARCDELASESNKVLDDKAQVVEDLHVARKQVVELKKTAAAAAASSASATSSAGGGGVGGGGRSQFTVEQLSTQLSVLKGRLACPVCNFRDKNCILTRCRHMFCRQCVDNNIKNRSRKCPACGIRFDTKDVGEIWL